MTTSIARQIEKTVKIFERSSIAGKLFIVALLIGLAIGGVWWVDSNRACPYDIGYAKQGNYIYTYIDCELASTKTSNNKNRDKLSSGLKVWLSVLP